MIEQTLQGQERRHERRYETHEAISLTVMDQGSKAVLARIADLSLGGFRLEGNIEAGVGERVTLSHSVAGAFEAEIMWKQGGSIGLRALTDSDEREQLLRYACLALYPDSDVPLPLRK